MRSAQLVILLLALRCFGQAGVEMPILYKLASASSFTPLTIPHAALWWHWLDITNGALTSWTDEVQAVVAYPAISGKSPINTTNGVWFNGDQFGVTNPPFALGTNYSVWISFVYSNQDGGGGFVIQDPLWGNYNSNFLFGSAFLTNPKFQMEYNVSTSQGSTVPMGAAANFQGAFTDWGFCMSNSSAGGSASGSAFGYTNGSSCAVTSRDSAPNFLGHMGYNLKYGDGQTYLSGSIRDLVVYTNYQLSSLDISNLHYYRTNFDKTSP